MIYLDNGATTLIKPKSVARAMKNAVGSCASPGRGGHKASLAAAETMFTCRCLAAELFGVSEVDNVVLTMNATHALNIAIKSCVGVGGRVVISGYEHNSVTRPLKALGADVAVARSPLFDTQRCLESFDRLTKNGADCVICSHVSNVFGYIQPVEEIAALCRRRGIPFILDASQSAGALDIDMEKLGAAFIAMPGHKGLYGPQGTGLLLCAGDSVPLLHGGTGSNSKLQTMPEFLPDRLEAGTHNVPGAAGLAEGLRFVLKRTPKEILRHERELIALAAEKLGKLSKVEVFAAEDPQTQSGVLSFRVRGMDCEQVAEKLDGVGIAVRAGLHCAPLAHESAGTSDTGTVRVSVSAFNGKRDVLELSSAVERL